MLLSPQSECWTSVGLGCSIHEGGQELSAILERFDCVTLGYLGVMHVAASGQGPLKQREKSMKTILSFVLYVILFVGGVTLIARADCTSDKCKPILTCTACSLDPFYDYFCTAGCLGTDRCLSHRGNCQTGCSPSPCIIRACISSCPL